MPGTWSFLVRGAEPVQAARLLPTIIWDQERQMKGNLNHNIILPTIITQVNELPTLAWLGSKVLRAPG